MTILRRGLWRFALVLDRAVACFDSFVWAHGPVLLALVAFSVGAWLGGICG